MSETGFSTPAVCTHDTNAMKKGLHTPKSRPHSRNHIDTYASNCIAKPIASEQGLRTKLKSPNPTKDGPLQGFVHTMVTSSTRQARSEVQHLANNRSPLWFFVRQASHDDNPKARHLATHANDRGQLLQEALLRPLCRLHRESIHQNLTRDHQENRHNRLWVARVSCFLCQPS